MADAIASGIASLQSAMKQSSGPGISNLGGAISALQAAGNAGVGAIGPAIDALSGGNSQVMKMTQWAWARNGLLAGLPSDGAATRADLTAALAALAQIVTWYSQAYRLAQSMHMAAPAAAAPRVAASPAPPQAAAAPALVKTVIPSAPSAGVTGKEVAFAGAGGLLGLAVGMRLAGSILGGPLGGLAGAALGFGIAKAMKV